MTAALWSTAPGDALEFPAAAGIDFFRNHSMLGLRRRRWRTVSGGSRTYVRALLDRLGAPLSVATPVRSVARTATGVELRCADGAVRAYDGVVVATSAPRALALLEDPSPDEREMLSAFETTANETVLHTDPRFVPARRSDRSSWNYQSPGVRRARRAALADVLPQPPAEARDGDGVLRDAQPHGRDRRGRGDPRDRLRASADDVREPRRRRARALIRSRSRHTAFAGAWQGNGFHEDGLVSGLRAAAAFGASW